MSEETKDEAAKLGKRAGTQAKNAAKNGSRAARVAAEAVADAVADEAQDTAQKAEATIEDVFGNVKKADPKLALATLAVFVGGTYLVGQFVGYRTARRALATQPID